MTSKEAANLKCYEKYSKFISSHVENFFFRLGQKIGEKPYQTIIICWAFVFLSALGFLNFHHEKNPIKLWTPPESKFAQDTEWLLNKFEQGYRLQIILIKSDDVLVPSIFQKLNYINKQVLNTRASDNISWENVCFKIPFIDFFLSTLMLNEKKSNNKTIRKQNSTEKYDKDPFINSTIHCNVIKNMRDGCLQKSVLEFWKYNDKKIQNITKEDILKRLNKTEISPETGHVTDYESLLGGIKRNASGYITSAETLLTIWMVDVNFTSVNMNEVGNDIGTADWATESALKWEANFLEIVRNASQNTKDYDIYYMAGRSFADISGASMIQDIPILTIGIFLMVLYVQVVISRYNCIEIRGLLGGIGLLSVGMAFIVACGLCSAFGIFYGPVHTSFPFLLMGLGVDDMFVIIACWEQIPLDKKRLPLSQQVGYMLQQAGVSITVTTLTDCVAFLVGSFTVLPSLRSFCLYAALGVFSIYIFVITFFTACFTIDQMRCENYRNGIVPCYQHKPYDKNECSQKNFLRTFFKILYSKVILTVPGKVFVIILTAVLTGFGIHGSLQLTQKFDPMWFIPENTYLYKYVEQRKVYYPTMGFEAGLYFGNLNYSYEFQNIKRAVESLENRTDILHVTSSWVQPFHEFVLINFNKDIDEVYLSDDEWSLYLSKFLFNPQGAKYQANFRFVKSLQCGSPAENIKLTMINYRFNTFRGPEEYLPAMHAVYDIAQSANVSTGDKFATAWGKIFANWVTDEIIDKELTRNLGLALLCVMCCTIILVANLEMCFWIFLCVLLTMINVCGWMQMWGLTIDIVSCIALTLAIGLCVDYAAHIGYTFLIMNEETKQERAIRTITHIGSAVLYGGLSTLLALSMLSQSEAYTFQAFFKIFFLVVLFGQFHGLVLLPVILSLIGPKPIKCHKPINQIES